MKSLLAIPMLLLTIACNEPNRSESIRPDSIPTIKPDTLDTSRVITTPPTGDSNVVNPDSTVENR